MNILLDKLPRSVAIDDIEYPINTNFRNFILFELMLEDKELNLNEKLFVMLSLFFTEKLPKNIDKAIDEIVWFYNCGKKAKERGSEEKNYSYEHDDMLIYAAFLSQYNVNLQSIEYLHWWEFMAMFQCLNETHLFTKAIGYRGAKIPQNMEERMKKFYNDMKEAFKLPNSENYDNRAIEYILMNGGNING